MLIAIYYISHLILLITQSREGDPMRNTEACKSGAAARPPSLVFLLPTFLSSLLLERRRGPFFEVLSVHFAQNSILFCVPRGFALPPDHSCLPRTVVRNLPH